MTRALVLGYLEARERVLGAVPLLPAENVPLARARGRALREILRAPHALPPFRNSSMDGYAVRASDLAGAAQDHPVELPVVEVLPAGSVASRELRAGEAMRIMTGAELPDGADAVVPFEDAESTGSGAAERARFRRTTAADTSVREAGADLAAGAEPFLMGRELSAHDLALLAALGISRVAAGPRPRVAVLSTGDELLGIEEPLRAGAIRDSNRPLLSFLLDEAGCEVSRAENLGDDPAAVGGAVRRALTDADVVITVGGISAGDFDPVKQSLESLGVTERWQVAMKPGKPQAFGILDGRAFFALPGNPASVACVFETLVRPALRKMQGHASLDRPRLGVRASERIESREGRTDFVRVTLEQREDGWWARPAGAQVSGHLTPQANAHALLVVPEAAAALAAGEVAEAWIWRWPTKGL